MSYKNGKDIFPQGLLKEIQEYVEGELVYIPKRDEKRAGWGRINGSRMVIEMRNHEICRMYNSGFSVAELIQKFHLSEDSIRKIVAKMT